MAKKATKAELIQEWTEPHKSWVPIQPYHYTQEAGQCVCLSKHSGLVYRPTPSGRLEAWADASLPLQAGQNVRFVRVGKHVLAQQLEVRSNAQFRGPREPLEEESTLTLLWDSEGQLPCPFPIEVDGRCAHGALFPQEDNGLLAYIHGVRYGAFNSMIRDLIRYAPSGEVLWKKDLLFATPFFCPDGFWLEQLIRTEGREVREYVWVDLEGKEGARFQIAAPAQRCVSGPGSFGELWVVLEDNGCRLLRLDRSGGETWGHLNSWVTKRFPAGEDILCLGGGLTLLERDTLQVRAALPDGEMRHFLGRDGQGRLWLDRRGMAECFDRDLHEVSRHRLRGSIMGSWLDGEENLCVVTYQAREELVRVYRLS